MAIDPKRLDELQQLSDACGHPSWVSLVEDRDISSGSSFIQVNEGVGEISDIELVLTPGRGSEVDFPRAAREVMTRYLDLIAAARTELPVLIAEIRRLSAELESLQNPSSQ